MDEFIITVVPTVIGKGIPLLGVVLRYPVSSANRRGEPPGLRAPGKARALSRDHCATGRMNHKMCLLCACSSMI
jgi:hypothetical protein